MLKYIAIFLACWLTLPAQAGGAMRHPEAHKGVEFQREAQGRFLRLEHPAKLAEANVAVAAPSAKEQPPEPALSPRSHPKHRSAMHF